MNIRTQIVFFSLIAIIIIQLIIMIFESNCLVKYFNVTSDDQCINLGKNVQYALFIDVFTIAMTCYSFMHYSISIKTPSHGFDIKYCFPFIFIPQSIYDIIIFFSYFQYSNCFSNMFNVPEHLVYYVIHFMMGFSILMGLFLGLIIYFCYRMYEKLT